ncbi:MAG: hypothetical protein ACTSPY_14860 [Candidatus Helarchaeota archaeon]
MSEEKKKVDQNIPPEVMDKLPPEIRAQLGVEEKQEQKTIFAPGTDTANIVDSLARLREGFEKIGLTLIGRMGEFTTTLERVSMAVGRIDKVESVASEVSYSLKKLEKKLDDFNENISRMTKSSEEFTNALIEIKRDIAELKSRPAVIQQVQPSQVQPIQPQVQPQVSEIPKIETTVPAPSKPIESTSIPITQEKVVPQDTATSTESVDIPKIEGSPIQKEVEQSIKVPEIEGGPIKPNITEEVSVPSIESEPIAPKEAGSFAADATPEALIEMTFQSLAEQLQLNLPNFKIADILDSARDSLHNTMGWHPVIYNIGKEARTLRRTEGNLTQATIDYLLLKFDEWKTKLLSK